MIEKTKDFLSFLKTENVIFIDDRKIAEKYSETELKELLKFCLENRLFHIADGKIYFPEDLEERIKNLRLPLNTKFDLEEFTNNFHFFTDKLKIPFVCFEQKKHKEVFPVNSRDFKNEVLRKIYYEYGEISTEEKLKNILNFCSAKAIFSGLSFELEPRVNIRDGCIYYDLLNENKTSVKISENGWEIVEAPTIFRRYSHMLPQDIPEKYAKIEDINLMDEFLNLLKNDDERFLLKVWIVASFIPSFPHPILTLHGSQGSAKSMTTRLLRLLIDPSMLKTMTLPRAEKDRTVALLHNYFLTFDNLRDMKKENSDLLCRACTGDAIIFRELFRDLDEIIASFTRIICVNGINIPGEEPDLLDRSILLEFERPSKTERREEKDIYESFYQKRPQILGSIFHILSKAIKIKKSLKLPELPRMADFCLWGEAISRGMGEPEMRFFHVYVNTIQTHLSESVEGDVVGICILKFLDSGNGFEGTASELLEKITNIASELKIDTKNKYNGFPSQPNTLMRKLNYLKTTFLERNIFFERLKEKGQRKIKIYRLPDSHNKENIVLTVPSSKPHKNLEISQNFGTIEENIPSGLSSTEKTEKNPVDDNKIYRPNTVLAKQQNNEELSQKDDKTIKKEDLHKCSFSDCQTQTELKTPLGAPVCLKHLKQQAELLFASEGKKELRFDDFIGIVTPEADKKMLEDEFWIEQHSGKRMLHVNAKDNYS